MLLFDNVVFSLQKAGGISRFWANLIAGFSASEDTVFIEPLSAISNLYRNRVSLRNIRCDRRWPVGFARYLNFSVRSPQCFGGAGGVFHSSYYRICRAPNIANVTTVHDLIYEKFAKGSARWLHMNQKRIALAHSECVVCVSENTKLDLLEYYPFVANKEVRVIPNAAGDFSERKVTDRVVVGGFTMRPSSYFLYVGHRGECKGFDKVVSALRAIDKDINLVVVGRGFSNEEQQFLAKAGVADRIVHVGTVSDEELNVLYSNALFLFFPSLYEGFGIPLLEAMMSGCAVVASRRSSIPEIVGDAGVLFDPDREEDIVESVKMMLDADVRAALVAKGLVRAGHYSWGGVVRSYEQIYRGYGGI